MDDNQECIDNNNNLSLTEIPKWVYYCIHSAERGPLGQKREREFLLKPLGPPDYWRSLKGSTGQCWFRFFLTSACMLSPSIYYQSTEIEFYWSGAGWIATLCYLMLQMKCYTCRTISIEDWNDNIETSLSKDPLLHPRNSGGRAGSFLLCLSVIWNPSELCMGSAASSTLEWDLD